MEETWLQSLREQFPVTASSAYFDIAYENCGASYMQSAIERFFSDKAALTPDMPKLGGAGKGRVVDEVASARRKLAEFLGAESEKNIAFTANTCQAISLALMGLKYAPGDNIVVGGMEHVSVLMPCLQMERAGVECKVVESENSLWVTAEELLAATDEHTKLVAVSYVQSGSGYRIDLKRLAEGCHERGILLLTDAIQALGFTELDVRNLGVDALAGSGYKGLLAMEGMGFLYCSDAMLAELEPSFACHNAALELNRETYEIECTDPLDARKLEAGTIPFAPIYVLSAALDIFRDIGIDNIARHISNCYEEVYRGLTALGYRVVTPLEVERHCHSMIIEVERETEMTEFLARRGVYVSAGKKGYVRVSVAPFTNSADIKRLLVASEEWKGNN